MRTKQETNRPEMIDKTFLVTQNTPTPISNIIGVEDLSKSHSDSRSNSSETCPCVVPSSKEEEGWTSGNMASSLCISTSLSHSTLLLSVIICAEVGAADIWSWEEGAGDSRGRGRDVAAAGEHGSRISRKRSSIAASETVSASWC